MPSPLARVTSGFICPTAGDVTTQVNPTSQLPLAVFRAQQQIVASLAPVRAINPVCPPTNIIIGTPDPFVIAAFSGNPTQLELGTDLLLPAFTAAYNRPPTNITLDDTDGNPQQVIPAPGAAFASVNNYTGKTTPNESVTWTLTADEGVGAPDTAQSTTVWRSRHWIGFHPSPGPLTEAQVLAMSQLTTVLTSNTTFDITFAPVAGVYLHHIIHDFFTLDAAKYFTDGLFNTGVVEQGAVSITPGGAGVPSAFTARDIASGLLDSGGLPIRFERRS